MPTDENRWRFKPTEDFSGRLLRLLQKIDFPVADNDDSQIFALVDRHLQKRLDLEILATKVCSKGCVCMS